jgi:hypothetical protein
MRHVFQCSSLALLLDSSAYFVSEKLDGSNLAVTSRGVVASRRNVLLHRNILHIALLLNFFDKFGSGNIFFLLLKSIHF